MSDDFLIVWEALYPQDAVVEVRIPQGKGVTSGYFSSPDCAVEAIKKSRLDGKANIYFTLNPVNPDLLARRANVLEAWSKDATNDTSQHIPHLRYLLIDCDAERVSGVSATEAEHDAALDRASAIREFLASEFGVSCVSLDSGNGGHLYLPVDLENNPANTELLAHVLKGLNSRFGDDSVHVDTSVANPSRITKMPGTLAVKGSSTPDRPHRRARVLSIPENLCPITREALEQIAAFLPTYEEPKVRQQTSSSDTFDVEAFLKKHSVPIHAVTSYRGGKRYQLERCPFNPEHGEKDAAVFFADGKPGFRCFHNGCVNNHWAEFRELFEPGYRAERERKQQEWKDRSTEARFSQRAEEVPEQTLPAFPEASDPEPLHEAAYHGIAGEFVRLLEPHSEADPVAILIQFLTAYGSVIGRNAFAEVGATHHFTNIYAVLVGTSAKSRKTSSWDWVQRIFQACDPNWADKRVQSGLSSGEGLIYAIRDPVEVEEPIKEKGVVTKYQTVIKDVGVEDKRLFVLEPEFARVLKVAEREGSTLSPIIRQAWDSGNLRVMTKTPMLATNGHISIVGNITIDELKRKMTDTELSNGFANRFIYCYVKRSKLLPEGGSLQESDLAVMTERVRVSVEFGRKVRVVSRNAQAKEAWAKVYEELSKEVPGLFASLTARAEAQVLRLSCLYALLDCSEFVCVEHLQAALALWQYAEDSVKFIFGDALGDPVADEILRALRNSPAGMTRTEISGLFGRNQSAGRLTQSLHLLAERKLVVSEKVASEGEKGQGRSSELWRAV